MVVYLRNNFSVNLLLCFSSIRLITSLEMAFVDKLFRWAETNSMAVKANGHPGLRAKLLEKLLPKRIPVVALLKKG